MKVIINGTHQEIAPTTSLAELIRKFTPSPQQIIAEVNGTIVEKTNWTSCQVTDGARIELVTFVGGG